MSSSRARPRPTPRSWATGARRGWVAGRELTGRGLGLEAWGEGGPALSPMLHCPPPRWAKGGFVIEDAHESRYETNVDYSFFTEPVSCEVHNKVGSTNVSTLVNVHCEWPRGPRQAPGGPWAPWGQGPGQQRDRGRRPWAPDDAETLARLLSAQSPPGSSWTPSPRPQTSAPT